MVRWLLLPALALVLAASSAAARAVVPRPQVTGPRTTFSSRPVYRFTAAGAVGFVCSFDDVHLHRCAARYSEPLGPGRHVLRVRAVARGGGLSAVVTVRVIVRALPPVPSALTAHPPFAVGDGPGVPAVAAGSVWVPNTNDGTVMRVDPATGSVVATIAGLPPAPVETGCPFNAACGYMNAAASSGEEVWVSYDFAGLVVQIASASNRVVGQVPVPARPGGLAVGGGFVWVFHTLRPTVTRIDASSGSAATFTVPGAQGGGIAYARGAVWLLNVDPPAVLRLDPETLAVTARIPLEPFGVRHPFRPAWSLAGDERSLWAANPNYDMVTEIDPATATVAGHVRLPRDQPFGVALGAGEAWVAARTGVVRIHVATGAVTGQLILPSVGSGYTGIAYGFGAAWVTDFDRDWLTRVVARLRSRSGRS